MMNKQSLLLRNKKIFVVHGWEGGPDKDWMPWAKRELERRGFEVIVPAMPDPDYPKINTWVEHLRKEVGKPDGNTILVGHSIGCQTILRYLETLQEGEKIGRVVLVAGFGQYLTGLTEEEKTVAGPWVETPIDFEKVKARADSFVALFSDNDPFVPPEENSRLFEEKLGAKIIIQKDKGHFKGDEGATELPILLDVL